MSSSIGSYGPIRPQESRYRLPDDIFLRLDGDMERSGSMNRLPDSVHASRFRDRDRTGPISRTELLDPRSLDDARIRRNSIGIGSRAGQDPRNLSCNFDFNAWNERMKLDCWEGLGARVDGFRQEIRIPGRFPREEYALNHRVMPRNGPEYRSGDRWDRLFNYAVGAGACVGSVRPLDWDSIPGRNPRGYERDGSGASRRSPGRHQHRGRSRSSEGRRGGKRWAHPSRPWDRTSIFTLSFDAGRLVWALKTCGRARQNVQRTGGLPRASSHRRVGRKEVLPIPLPFSLELGLYGRILSFFRCDSVHMSPECRCDASEPRYDRVELWKRPVSVEMGGGKAFFTLLPF